MARDSGAGPSCLFSFSFSGRGALLKWLCPSTGFLWVMLMMMAGWRATGSIPREHIKRCQLAWTVCARQARCPLWSDVCLSVCIRLEVVVVYNTEKAEETILIINKMLCMSETQLSCQNFRIKYATIVFRKITD